MTETPKHTNRLAQETSPYLLQHAHNPVDWYPWGSEAWERAKAEDRPVLVSIGYAACHWCHVMEHESFEDEAVAAVQNDLFISIKVDREERPDIDEIYMEAVQIMRGQGGWPLNAFCLPDGRPFFGGTYFPPAGRQGMPAWPEVLEAVAGAYREHRDDVVKQAGTLLEHLERRPAAGDAADALDPIEAMRVAARTILQTFDAQEGGYGGAPKFPQPLMLRLLLRYARRHGDDQARDQVLLTLRKMAEGGMYDHLAGGFHRYSVDRRWLVPHFEKMLYDNALLPPLYVQAYGLTGDAFFRRVAEETLDYLIREMRAPEGAFYSSTDADSEGEEGKYFVWTLAETERLLGPEDAAVFNRYYDVTAHGNFEGCNILHPTMTANDVANRHQLTAADVEAVLARGRAALLAARATRVPPATDTKVIVAWNGLAIDALARAGAVLAAPRFTEAARTAAAFLLDTLRRPHGLLRIYAGGKATIPAFLEDYAALADGLLSLYEATGEERWFSAALDLGEDMLAKFWDHEQGAFFSAGPDNEPLITRNKPVQDGATPSGNSHAALVLARLYALTARSDLADRLEQAQRAHGALLTRAATAMPLLLEALDWVRSHQAVAVIGEPGRADTLALLDVVRRGDAPDAFVIQRTPDAPTVVPQLDGKSAIDGNATAYVCHGFACSAPVTAAQDLTALLRAGPPA